MSTITCQQIVSCFETQLTETTTTLKLRVAAPPPTNLDFSNWGFLQTTPCNKSADNNNNNTKESCYTYTHPWSEKPSFSRLSAKSLELCTENLGSETGTDIITDGSSIFSSPSSTAAEIINPVISDDKRVDESDDRRQKTTASSVVSKKASCRETKNFPPPLTTMSGSSSLQVRRRRDGGRLIIEAVEAPFRNSYLQAERSDGRLRLCFLTPGGSSDHRSETTTTTTNTSAAGETAAAASATEEEEIEEAVNEVESKTEKYHQRRRRCNQSGHGNKGFWKPALWVATS